MAPTTSLVDLSHQVLLTAAACVPAGDSERTSRLLYHGNWLPVTPAWLERFPDDAAVQSFAVGDTAAAVLKAGWIRSPDPNWIHWMSTRAARPSRFKVYVSVLPERLPEAFLNAVTVLRDTDVVAVKLSRRPRALLRPDRLVIHCGQSSRHRELVDELAGALADIPAQGVPFTAQADTHPGVSWAMDPPQSVASYAGSWRRWVSRKAAGYLHASDAPTAGERVDFALTRLLLDGIEVDTWAPTADIWARQ